MVSAPLKPNVDDLQNDVIELLGEISALMDRAIPVLSSAQKSKRSQAPDDQSKKTRKKGKRSKIKTFRCGDNPKSKNQNLKSNVSYDNKYAQLKKLVDDALHNVQDFELRMAIVAPMNAGKSTIINAIIGEKLLPSRNTAMTALPTEIIFKSDKSSPTLTLSQEILSVFQNILEDLNSQIEELGLDKMQQKIADSSELKYCLDNIQEGLPIEPNTSGGQKVINSLKYLNDIIRLYIKFNPTKEPMAELTELPRIETNFWRSQGIQPSKRLGNLVIVDMPGYDDAKETLKLTSVVEAQLKKSSIVLIVLDFNQLKGKAVNEVNKKVQPVIECLGTENFYVLVNKIDQRTNDDTTPEDLRNLVTANLGLSKPIDTNRMFEASAIQAFSAANFMRKLQRSPGVDICHMDRETVEGLAQQVLGGNWKIKLESLALDSSI